MSKFKGGPGSGRRPGAGPSGNKPTSNPRSDRTVVPAYTAPQGPKEQVRAGSRARDLFPLGRNSDGTARTSNDIRDTSKPVGHTDKPKKS